MHAAGGQFQAIPYRGDAPLNTALIAGEVHLAVVPFATAKPNIDAATCARWGSRAQACGIAARGADHRGKRRAGLRLVELARLVRAGRNAAEVIALIQREAARRCKCPMSAPAWTPPPTRCRFNTGRVCGTVQGGSGAICQGRERRRHPAAGLARVALRLSRDVYPLVPAKAGPRRKKILDSRLRGNERRRDPNRTRCRDEAKMTIQGLGYIGVRAKSLEDWRASAKVPRPPARRQEPRQPRLPHG